MWVRNSHHDQYISQRLFLIKCKNIFTLINYIMTAIRDQKKILTELTAFEIIDRIIQELDKDNTCH